VIQLNKHYGYPLNSQLKEQTIIPVLALSKNVLKVQSYVCPNAYSTYFPLAEVYEAEICRLRNENQFLVTQMNEALAQLHREQAENAPFKASQKPFFELYSKPQKKRRIRNLVDHVQCSR